MGNKDNQNQIGNWGEWEPWDVCSATCGKGVTTRRRTCSPVGAKCQGDNTETDECLLTPCCVPRNGMWGDWSDWSTCSSSCGGGSHTRSRICTGTNSCGQYCQGKSNESTACNVQACLRPPAVPSITTNPQTSPFSAGVTVTLTCSSPDLGSPPATLTWDTAREGMRTTRKTHHMENAVRRTSCWCSAGGARTRTVLFTSRPPPDGVVVVVVSEGESVVRRCWL
ncbi:hypothetical protein C0Q70_12939 [Pomacea canaliculata]|uniref:Ig-like domain-containing protein n=1 Tax=Pomacea canaliculata TaxID=400727 RepID=A0A2T7P2W2_POMCA|nr:hypothetical protein C0Q70_12939 [Pomacea canaliculata]